MDAVTVQFRLKSSTTCPVLTSRFAKATRCGWHATPVDSRNRKSRGSGARGRTTSKVSNADSSFLGDKLRTNRRTNTTTTTTVLRPLYWSACVSRHIRLRTGEFCCWCKVLLPACPCWRQPWSIRIREKTPECSSTVQSTLSPYLLPKKIKINVWALVVSYYSNLIQPRSV